MLKKQLTWCDEIYTWDLRYVSSSSCLLGCIFRLSLLNIHRIKSLRHKIVLSYVRKTFIWNKFFLSWFEKNYWQKSQINMADIFKILFENFYIFLFTQTSFWNRNKSMLCFIWTSLIESNIVISLSRNMYTKSKISKQQHNI